MTPSRARRRPKAAGESSASEPRSGGSRGLGGEQVEGIHAVEELLRVGKRKLRDLRMVEDRSPAHAALRELADAAGVRVRFVTAEELAADATTDAPQGVLARAQPVPEAQVDDLLAAPNLFLLALDGVTDPGNVGAVLRVADTAGVTGVVLPRHRNARLTAAALKAAAGAVEHLSIATVSGIPTFLERARRAGVWSVGLDADGDVDVFELEVADGPLVLVLGAEGRGLGRLTRARCEIVARIPLHGALGSLNVATAAAVACHAVAHRRAR